MDPISRHSGIAAPLPLSDVNTDLIYPQRYLRKPDRLAMAPYLFHDLRFDENGDPEPDFILNREPYNSATILIAGRNFGSGSSREHAPWALKAFGFRVLISSMFADIFRANCVNNGIVPAVVPEEVAQLCLEAASNPQDARFGINLETRTITHPRLGEVGFSINDSDRDRLLSGSDFVDVTLESLPDIERYEAAARSAAPWRFV
ncbi:3-isopropylmalate dehydratase small subunit [Puniceibacterium sp. IMCC21224]|uniref:3-isopropylmalate dehydratase small subunit n=1 Tax=Puniceibacterium sp. IMCC21224 TaxID=1618204 RepID=UPI00065DBC93|nr:3-isopropylmalate dehydratase small subunit [Puniceibacterium sp. IMCC21224]KMK64935.1 3-isopropylmalate dehydratase, small subunit [Puniceibacterium sp. IMCC21224]